MARVESIFDERLEKHLLWSAEWTTLDRYKHITCHQSSTVRSTGGVCFHDRMLDLKREDERKILAAKMNWLRRLSGISKLERRRNEEIRPKDRIRKRRLQWLRYVEKMNNGKLPIRALHTRVEGARSRGRQLRKKTMD